MYSKVNTMAILGIDGMSVSAEVDVSSGLPEFSLVGYLSSEVKEARERVKISLKNSGFRLEPAEDYGESCACRCAEGGNRI